MNVQGCNGPNSVVANNRDGIMNLTYINFYNNKATYNMLYGSNMFIQYAVFSGNNCGTRLIWGMGDSLHINYCYIKETANLIGGATFGTNCKTGTVTASYQVFALNTAECRAIPPRSPTPLSSPSFPLTLTNPGTGTPTSSAVPTQSLSLVQTSVQSATIIPASSSSFTFSLRPLVSANLGKSKAVFDSAELSPSADWVTLYFEQSDLLCNSHNFHSPRVVPSKDFVQSALLSHSQDLIVSTALELTRALLETKTFHHSVQLNSSASHDLLSIEFIQSESFVKSTFLSNSKHLIISIALEFTRVLLETISFPYSRQFDSSAQDSFDSVEVLLSDCFDSSFSLHSFSSFDSSVFSITDSMVATEVAFQTHSSSVSESLIIFKDITISKFLSASNSAGAASLESSDNALLIAAITSVVALVTIILIIVIILVRRHGRSNDILSKNNTSETEFTCESVRNMEEVGFGEHVFTNPLDEMTTADDPDDTYMWSENSMDEEVNEIPLASPGSEKPL
jgi:hypothetical protein